MFVVYIYCCGKVQGVGCFDFWLYLVNWCYFCVICIYVIVGLF